MLLSCRVKGKNETKKFMIQGAGDLLWFAVDEADGRAEGSWDEVMRLIGQAHVMLHDQGIVRIQTDIRVGSR